MSFPRLSVIALVLLCACASSRPGGSAVDASDDDPDAADTADADLETDGAAVDSSSVDSAGIDGAGIDSAVDAPGLDAPTDAATDANTCPTSPCDLHQQCGCTSPLVCDLDFTDLVGTSCRAVNQAGTETSTCFSGNPPQAQSSYCAAGYVCVGAGASATCERYCDATSDCGQPRGQCVIQLMNGAMTIAGATTCSSNCNPVNSAAGGCPTGMKCGFFTITNTLTGGVARDIVDCTTPGAGTHGTTCANDSTCASDTLCSTSNALTRCRRTCNLTTGGNECASLAGTTCTGFGAPGLVVGGTTYGVCLP